MNENRNFVGTNSGPADTKATKEGVDRLAAGAHSGIDAASEAAHPAIDRIASGAHRAVNSADEAASHATDAIAKAGNKASVKGEELYAASASYMREHPVFTIGVAVAAGYLLSRLMATR
jgi:ElaB/YqjD/DUF883 family membrane-anchored ribosome-binding protein